MKKVQKTLALFLTPLMALSVLSGCAGKSASSTSGSSSSSSQSTSSEATHKAVTITTNLGDGEISKDEIAQAKEKFPWITVKLVTMDDAKMAAELATGTAPDLIHVTGAFEASGDAIKGIAMDITNRLQSSSVIKMDDLLPVTNVYRFDGKTIGKGPYYGLPKDWSNDFALFVDKKCFDAANVQVPDSNTVMTWEDIFALAQKLTIKKDGKVVQYGLSDNEWGKTDANFNQMLQYVTSAGGKLSSDDNTSMDFNIPAVKNYLNMWVTAAKANVGPNALNNDQTSGGDLFLGGKSAMIIDGYWYNAVISSNDKTKTHLDDFEMLPTPIAKGGTRVAATGSATGLIIYSKTKNPDDAWDIFEWYIGGSPADDRAKAGWGYPIFKSKESELPNSTSFNKQVNAVMASESQYMSTFLPVNPYLAGGGWSIFDKYYQQLIFGKVSIDDMISGMTKDANAAVTEAKNAIG